MGGAAALCCCCVLLVWLLAGRSRRESKLARKKDGGSGGEGRPNLEDSSATNHNLHRRVGNETPSTVSSISIPRASLEDNAVNQAYHHSVYRPLPSPRPFSSTTEMTTIPIRASAPTGATSESETDQQRLQQQELRYSSTSEAPRSTWSTDAPPRWGAGAPPLPPRGYPQSTADPYADVV